MDYLFTQQHTVLFFLFLVYAGFTLIQLMKMAISAQLDRPVSIFRSIWLFSRVVFVLPLLWTFAYFL